ncbi:MAG: DUF1579 domain-containing protein [Thermoanaerobaculia bacterium]
MKIRTRWIPLFLVLFALPLAAGEEPPAQQPMDEAAMMEAYVTAGMPGEAHEKLAAFVGTWDTTVRMWAAPGAPPSESTGVAENRLILGGRWLEQRFTSSFMGEEFEGLGYTGYDNAKKHYVGTWMDSMSSGIMLTTGEAADAKTFTFSGTMDDPVMGKSMLIKEKIVIHGDDRHVMEMWGPGPDGKMFKNMEIEYVRKN